MAMNNKFLVSATAIAFSVALTGCAGMGSTNRSVDSIHQPVVGQTHYAMDLSTDGGTLTPQEQQRLADWLEAMRVGYGDRISIDDPNPYSNGGAHQSIANVVKQHGILLSAGAPITQGQVTPGAVRVVLSRTVAEVPGCPDWSTKSATDFNSGTSSNYGCAINSNLAAMVADPNDLVQGKPHPKLDPNAAAKAINVYRDAVPTGKNGLKNNDTTGGN